ncbi:MAG TPA: 30S ribosomal protein S8 [Caldithrix abyssi]|uniref:Small ribosomal subunit protein uS8 n=1 Tax=Caldithrix abyssi TaxID=187145 RepID=A0A7V4TXR3_CALAY|nr:30S ribosomal protein S8 [Caldithrix abyssi]
MSMTDPVADYLTRVRNALHAKYSYVDIPASNLKRKMSRILLEQGFIKKYIIIRDGKQGLIRIWLKYDEEGNPVINKIIRVSKPGRRQYVNVDNLPRVKNNLGIAILTTPRGVITAQEAKRQNVGGEVLCYIW